MDHVTFEVSDPIKGCSSNSGWKSLIPITKFTQKKMELFMAANYTLTSKSALMRDLQVYPKLYVELSSRLITGSHCKRLGGDRSGCDYDGDIYRNSIGRLAFVTF